MRVGKNPTFKEKNANTRFNHQVIIPVFLPNDKGYFKDGFQIFRKCLNSLFKSVNASTFITIVNNGSADYVIEFLNKLHKEGKVHEVVHTSNIGKTNAVFKGLQGHNFPLITIADADVLFVKGWQNATVKTFNEFPKAGVVGLIPQLKMFNYLCSNIIFDKWFSRQLYFTDVSDPDGIKSFIKSIGWDDNYNKDYLKKHLTITSKNNVTAVVGTGHVVATYRNWALPKTVICVDEKLSPKYDSMFLDAYVLKKDGWRLTTAQSYAYHLGNVWESWMDKELTRNFEDDNLKLKNGKTKSHNKRVMFFVKSKLFKKLLDQKVVMKYFLKLKGLPTTMVKNY